jgi:hypothetical protein
VVEDRAMIAPRRARIPAEKYFYPTHHGAFDLSDFEPQSLLQVLESRVERAKFPVLDFHTHITKSAKSENGVELASERK